MASEVLSHIMSFLCARDLVCLHKTSRHFALPLRNPVATQNCELIVHIGQTKRRNHNHDLGMGYGALDVWLGPNDVEYTRAFDWMARFQKCRALTFSIADADIPISTQNKANVSALLERVNPLRLTIKNNLSEDCSFVIPRRFDHTLLSAVAVSRRIRRRLEEVHLYNIHLHTKGLRMVLSELLCHGVHKLTLNLCEVRSTVVIQSEIARLQSAFPLNMDLVVLRVANSNLFLCLLAHLRPRALVTVPLDAAWHHNCDDNTQQFVYYPLTKAFVRTLGSPDCDRMEVLVHMNTFDYIFQSTSTNHDCTAQHSSLVPRTASAVLVKPTNSFAVPCL